MTKIERLVSALTSVCSTPLCSMKASFDDLTIEVPLESLMPLLYQLRDHESFQFNQLIDLCAVDYLHYGQSDWETHAATDRGFSRAVERNVCQQAPLDHPRFAVVYHLLSTVKNHRLRVKVYLDDANLMLPSAHEVWKVANWFEREAYDLFGVLFSGHPDLRRILTDYGFIGHPFRKDFPVSGHVEMRYDAVLQKVIYEPIDLEPRILEPKVIREQEGGGQPI